MSKRYWTGIGTRNYLPQLIVDQQFFIGNQMAMKGWDLLTGGARVSDYNFLNGALHDKAFEGNAHVVRHINCPYYTTVKNRCPRLELMEDSDMEMVKEYYFTHGIFKPEQFNGMQQIAQELHARNFFQVMNEHGKVRSEFIAYASKEDRWGNVSGGTRTAVAIGRVEKLPMFNLNLEGRYNALQEFIEELPNV